MEVHLLVPLTLAPLMVPVRFQELMVPRCCGRGGCVLHVASANLRRPVAHAVRQELLDLVQNQLLLRAWATSGETIERMAEGWEA